MTATLPLRSGRKFFGAATLVALLISFSGIMAAQNATLNGVPNQTVVSATTIVSGLAAASPKTGQVFIVTDGTTSSDCTTGGGSTPAWCRSNGTVWSAVGGGSGAGLGDPGANGLVKRTGLNTTAAATAGTDYQAAITTGTTAQYLNGTLALTTFPVALPPNGTASGDLSGSYPNPNVGKINGVLLTALATGLYKNTTATGALSIAVAGTDYVLPTGNTATATALAALPSACSAGSAPTGILANGNATGCAAMVTTAVFGALNSVGFSATPAFAVLPAQTQKITLTSNVTSSTVTGAAGPVNFIVCQNATGGWTFAWPSGTKGGMSIGTTLSTCSAQSFGFDGTNLYATSTGVVNQ